MIKALLKKQFAELISQFSRQNGTKRSSPKRGLIIFVALFVVLYLSIGTSVFTFAKGIFEVLDENSFPLFYMAVGLISAAIGLLGSVFNAYSTIYEAKDTEILLSLPIPPHRIVFTRVVPLLVMTLLYSGAALLPSYVAFLLYGKQSALGCINAGLLFLPLTLLVEAITIGIAFVVAAIARRVKNKKVIVVLFSMAFVAIFYLIYFRAQSVVTDLVASGSIPSAARYALFFFYSMGRASQGSTLDMLIVTATGAGAFLLAYFLLSRYFIKFTTAKKTISAKGKKGVIKSASRRFSLFKREWKIFSSSPAYVMNCAFGVIFLIAVPIVAIVKADALNWLIEKLAVHFPKTNGCALAALAILLTEGMCCITAPAISIEGRRIYLLRVLPIDPGEVFLAKMTLHLVVVLPGALFASITLAAVLGADVLAWIFLILVTLAHTVFTGAFGLCMNINMPILDWKDEVTAIKSGVSVLISVFGTMIATTTVGVLYFGVAAFLSDGVYLAIETVLYLIADVIMICWMRTKGKKKFERLG